MDKRTIEMIIMGRAVPEQRRNGRIGHCTAGYSPTLDSLVRLYPVPFGLCNRWDHIEVEVEKPSQDTRTESWKIFGSKSHWHSTPERITKIGKLQRTEWIELIHKLSRDCCVKQLNKERASLCVIKPHIIDAFIDEKDDPKYKWGSHLRQMTLNGGFLPKTGRESPHHVRIIYRCQNCESKNPHKQQLLEWGAYRWIDKNPQNKEQAIVNLQLFNDDYEKYFLIGNNKSTYKLGCY